MAVLVEAISVVVRRSVIESKYPGGWDGFVADAPNATLCADPHLARLGFLSPIDVKDYVSALGKHGICYLDNAEAQDLVVVDQIRGPSAPCPWIEFGHVDLDGVSSRRISVCRLAGDRENAFDAPRGWEFEGSLSCTYGFVPTGQEHKSLTFLRHEDGTDVYLNLVTGKEVFVGRVSGDP